MKVKMKYSEEIIKRLATNSLPLSPFDLKKETKFPYSGIRETIEHLFNEGYVKLESVKPSSKGGTKKFYNLTFKGVLKYLSTFNIFPVSLTEISKKDAEVYYEKFCEKHGKNLLNMLERQGKILNYAPFQESRWLSEHHPGIIRLFINQAKNHLNPSLNNTGQFADKLSKNLSNPDFPFGVDDLRELRGAENSFLRDAFGKTFLLNMGGRIKKDSENEKLRLFAERILNENKVEIASLERAASLFSK